jgi:SAM-dependent methyltransferase
MDSGYLAFASDWPNAFEGVEAELFSILVEIEPGHFWFESRNKLIIWSLQQFFPEVRNFLEIGCGTGFVLSGIKKALPHVEVAGSDVFIKGLSFANKRVPEARLFQMDARHIPFEEEYDVVGLFDVLEHIEEDEVVLQELFRATKLGGGIILTVPQHPFLWSHFDTISHHQRRYSCSEMLQKVERAGFTIKRVTSFMSFLFPLLFASRLQQRGPQADYNIRTQLEKNRIVNFSLRKILNLEVGLIRGGLSFHLEDLC